MEKTMSVRKEVMEYTQSLLETFRFSPRHELPLSVVPGLMEYWEQGSVADIVSELKRHMNVRCKLRVGVVRSGGPCDAAAWVKIPDPFPFFGTPQYDNTELTIFIKKSMIEDYAFDTAIACVAHELSHIVLESIRHEHRKKEEAVDITGMLLGFKRFFLRGCYQSKEVAQYGVREKFGYLTEEELVWVSQH